MVKRPPHGEYLNQSALCPPSHFPRISVRASCSIVSVYVMLERLRNANMKRLFSHIAFRNMLAPCVALLFHIDANKQSISYEQVVLRTQVSQDLRW